MAKLLMLALAFSVVFVETSEGKTLLCSRCDSKKELYRGECQNDPPQPSRCPGGSAVEQYCIIAKEYAKNGSLMGYIRDCSVNANEDTCRDINSENPKSPARICITSCGTTGCNGVKHSKPSTAFLVFGLIACSMMVNKKF